MRTYYTYDVGNQLTRLHELPDDTHTYFAYDSRGNTARIHDPVATTYFTYNDADRVTTIARPATSPQYYTYDALLRRTAVETITAGVKSATYYAWDRNGMNNLMGRSHGHTPVDGIGSLVAQGNGIYDYFPVYDHRGTVVRGLIHSTVTGMAAYYEYNAFGQPLRAQNIQNWPQELRYQTNWEWIGTYGGHDLYRTPTRLYNATLGRFLQRDPKGYVDGMNLYEYVRSAPMQWNDPTGLKDSDPVTRAIEELKSFVESNRDIFAAAGKRTAERRVPLDQALRKAQANADRIKDLEAFRARVVELRIDVSSEYAKWQCKVPLPPGMPRDVSDLYADPAERKEALSRLSAMAFNLAEREYWAYYELVAAKSRALDLNTDVIFLRKEFEKSAYVDRLYEEEIGRQRQAALESVLKKLFEDAANDSGLTTRMKKLNIFLKDFLKGCSTNEGSALLGEIRASLPDTEECWPTGCSGGATSSRAQPTGPKVTPNTASPSRIVRELMSPPSARTGLVAPVRRRCQDGARRTVAQTCPGARPRIHPTAGGRHMHAMFPAPRDGMPQG